MEENAKGTKEQKKNLKGIIARSSLSFAFALAIFLTVFFLELYGPFELTWEKNKYRMLSDSFSLGGLLPILFWLLVWVSEKGAFDLIVYSVRKLFSFTFRIHPEKSNLPPTYADYVAIKKAKRKPFHYELLLIGGAFLLLGLVFVLVWYKLES
ncbi:MAG TPA: hypothetical protein DDW18_03795 [Firmicutes bacterium]|nr:hypothetical protein [Bacillota bacterium]HBM99967.1 hypothetical protein [Bacillota bacterium]